MGTEHPFNPIVALLSDPIPADAVVNETSESSTNVEPYLTFQHESFLFIPYTVQGKLQAQALKESQMQQSKNTKSFRRQAPQIPDSVSNGYSTNSSLTDATGYRRLGGHPNYGGGFRGKGFVNSPNNRGQHGAMHFRGPQPIPIPGGVPVNVFGHPIYPLPMEMNYLAMSPPGGAPPAYPYPGMPIYPPPMGMPMPFPPHPYYPHNSVSSSVSSSYQSSPLSLSPMGHSSYMPMMRSDQSLGNDGSSTPK
jgi:hypothetical protein